MKTLYQFVAALLCAFGLHWWTEREDAEYGGRVYRCEREGCHAQKQAWS